VLEGARKCSLRRTRKRQMPSDGGEGAKEQPLPRLLQKASKREPEPDEEMRPRDGAGNKASLRHPGSTGCSCSDPHARLGVLRPAK